MGRVSVRFSIRVQPRARLEQGLQQGPTQALPCYYQSIAGNQHPVSPIAFDICKIWGGRGRGTMEQMIGDERRGSRITPALSGSYKQS